MVRAIMIVEVAGNPPAHLKEAISTHVGNIGKLKDVEVHSTTINEPREIEKRDQAGKPTGEMTGFYTCFAEIDLETENFLRMSEIVFDYMPSSIEITEPGKVTMNLNEASNLLNTYSGRMHRYDEAFRVAQARINQLSKALEGANKGPVKTAKKVAKKSKKKTSKK